MSHFQRRPDYGLRALHDDQLLTHLHHLHKTYQKEPTFIQTILEIAKIFNESPTPAQIIALNIDFDTLPTHPISFFHHLLNLAKAAPHTAAACLDVSNIQTAVYRAATGGVKELTLPYRAAFFIDRFVSRVQEFQLRDETPFATLRALIHLPNTLDFDQLVSRYELFLGPQESDGRIQGSSFPDQVVARTVLFALVVIYHDHCLTEEQRQFQKQWYRKLAQKLGQHFDPLLHRYSNFVSNLDMEQRINALLCALAGRNFIIEQSDEALVLYYWDPTLLAETRAQLQKYSEDANGPKLYGYYWRMIVAWTLVLAGLLLAILSGILNWGNRESNFERVNDVFQTFLLILAIPGFTVKIAATNGEQAIKDWLVGIRRIKDMEDLERQIHKRIHGNKRRAWLAIQRVKCETDDKQNWTAPDNMCFKTAHLDGSLRARKDRNMAELELVIGSNGQRARSWIEISNETNILGKDVNHLQFTCGTTDDKRTAAFFSHTPSPRVWFA